MTTDTELKAMAPAAMTGLRNPKSPRISLKGPAGMLVFRILVNSTNRSPAAIGISRVLYMKAQKRFCLIILMVALEREMASGTPYVSAH